MSNLAMAPNTFAKQACCLVALLACLSLLNFASAHGGSFHFPYTPKDNGYPYAVVKECTKFLTLPAAATNVPGGPSTKGPRKGSSHTKPTARLEGYARVQFYFYKNCSSRASTDVELKVQLTNSVKKLHGRRVPVVNYTMAGVAMTKSCKYAMSADNKMYNLGNDPDPMAPYNYIWFKDATTGPIPGLNTTLAAQPGWIVGHGANDGKPKNPETIRSLVLYDVNDSTNPPRNGSLIEDYKDWIKDAIFCCDFGSRVVEPDWETKLYGIPGTDC